jgi:hypothetical protein
MFMRLRISSLRPNLKRAAGTGRLSYTMEARCGPELLVNYNQLLNEDEAL